MDAKLFTSLVHLTLAVFLVILTPGPTSSAPLALRIQLPMDIRQPVVLRNHPPPAPHPTRPNPAIPIVSAHTSGNGVGGAGANDSDNGVKKASGHLTFLGMDLPRAFGAYDLDQSRGVSLVELAAVTDTELKDAREPFSAADKDGNNILSQEEFTQAPWIFDASGITLIESVGEPLEEVEQDTSTEIPPEKPPTLKNP